jgi:hypothetical protein
MRPYGSLIGSGENPATTDMVRAHPPPTGVWGREQHPRRGHAPTPPRGVPAGLGVGGMSPPHGCGVGGYCKSTPRPRPHQRPEPCSGSQDHRFIGRGPLCVRVQRRGERAAQVPPPQACSAKVGRRRARAAGTQCERWGEPRPVPAQALRNGSAAAACRGCRTGLKHVAHRSGSI